MRLIRFLFYAVLLWLLYRLVKSLWSGRQQPPAPGARGRGSALHRGELVQDPVCGVYVPKSTAVPGGEGQWFCSERCRDAFGSGR